MLQDTASWHFDYPRLVCDAGFAFERHKSQNLEKSKISKIDVDRIIKEKDITTLEKCIPAVIQFILDPDQAELLDSRFVNTFRLSQLSLEYLLFCKKYLDNTVVLLKEDLEKVKQENNELKGFVEELKDHIALLMRKAKEQQCVYKCEECNKLFSTDEFLTAHKKRRHDNVTLPPNHQSEPESSNLHLEIKELKGRLNTAEKLLQDQNKPPTDRGDSSVGIDKSESKIDELQENFQKLKSQVEIELKQLERQLHFEEKCEKWFGLAMQNMKDSNLNKNSVITTSEASVEVREKRESTTQTESLQERKTSLHEPKEVDNNQNQFALIQEVIESKVTSSLHKIETQMDSFWMKINQLEAVKAEFSNDKENQGEEQQKPPLVKPRTKHSPKIKIMAESPKPAPRDVNLRKIAHESSTESETELESSVISMSESSKSLEIVTPPPNKVAAVEKPKKSSRFKVPPLKEQHAIKIEETLCERLQELGISPDWQGLPYRSFTRALEIVNHQANLLKKTYPDFSKISNEIEVNVSELLKNRQAMPKPTKNTSKSRKLETRGSTVARVEIKNRHMYERDSDNESEAIRAKTEGPVPYSAVIQELKAVNLAKFTYGDRLSSDLESLEHPGGEGETLQNDNKGVLKNYPSVGSLTKKKVLFNLDDTSGKSVIKVDADDEIGGKGGGSTTSLGSSLLDGTPRNTNKRDIEDLSDFDFSEM